jgi:hypothetical protein
MHQLTTMTITAMHKVKEMILQKSTHAHHGLQQPHITRSLFNLLFQTANAHHQHLHILMVTRTETQTLLTHNLHHTLLLTPIAHLHRNMVWSNRHLRTLAHTTIWTKNVRKTTLSTLFGAQLQSQHDQQLFA